MADGVYTCCDVVVRAFGVCVCGTSSKPCPNALDSLELDPPRLKTLYFEIILITHCPFDSNPSIKPSSPQSSSPKSV